MQNNINTSSRKVNRYYLSCGGLVVYPQYQQSLDLGYYAEAVRQWTYFLIVKAPDVDQVIL